MLKGKYCSILTATLLALLCTMLTSCGFHPQGEISLAKPLHKLYLQTNNPYGMLARNLKDSLRLSHVTLTSDPKLADTILVIDESQPGKTLTSVSGTQQTRQYSLTISVSFSINDSHGRQLVPPQSLAESRSLTIQSNQILGSSNETSTYYRQIRRSLASAIMNRLGSKDISTMLKSNYPASTSKRSS